MLHAQMAWIGAQLADEERASRESSQKVAQTTHLFTTLVSHTLVFIGLNALLLLELHYVALQRAMAQKEAHM